MLNTNSWWAETFPKAYREIYLSRRIDRVVQKEWRIMSYTPPTLFAHGATGAIGVQGYASGATQPTSYVTLAIKSWEAEYTKAKHDTSNTSVAGFTVAQPGKATCKFTVEAQLALSSTTANTYDQTHMPVSASGPDLQADYCSAILVGGTTQGGSPVTVTSTVGQQIFNIPQAIITSFKITNKEGDVINYTLTGESSGVFTINQGS